MGAHPIAVTYRRNFQSPTSGSTSGDEKYSNIKYKIYGKEFKQVSITICKLGHEECEDCVRADHHDENHSKKRLDLDNTGCRKYQRYRKRADGARKLYKVHANIASSVDDTVFYCVDMEKMIMLP